ncbi:hypothetical protein [Dactylosporangium matsuzakiense]|uniref:hypothetical protein n=1 Tax=Dactylosporangium matsuzakiense TaxID=53360 RepID=UPI0022F2CC66|nr:hypothetical protein [Dactylosporangium matsuzakiense]
MELLTALATGTIPLTHEALHDWPRPAAARYLRHRLVTCGVLPPIDRHLADLETWLRRRLAAVADHPHEHLLRQFALWHHLPRVRADAARRPLRANAKQYVTQQFTQAQAFLTWLVERGIAPRDVVQAHIDAWYSEHRVHQRHNLRGFLIWAVAHRHLPRRLIVPQPTYQSAASFTQQRRMALLRRYLTEDATPLTSRAAACLLLLYAQPLSRILHLTTDELTTVDGELLLRLGDPPSPVPAPFNELLNQLAAASAHAGTTLLFPGLVAGQPLAYSTLNRRLRKLGFPLIEARVSALRQLVLQAPAPVVADALGYHQTTTARQVAHAGATWSRYAGNEHHAGPRGRT